MATEGRQKTEKGGRKKEKEETRLGGRKGGEMTGQTNTAVGSRVSRPPRCLGNPGYL